MALPTDILLSECISATEMTFVCVGSRCIFNFCSCLLNHVSSSDNTYTVMKQVGSGLTCVQHFVQISAGIQTVVSEVFH
jgi:hypothetical protein